MNYTVYLVSKDETMSRIVALYVQKEGWNLKLLPNMDRAKLCVHESPSLWIFDLERIDLMKFEVIHMIKLHNPKTPVILVSSNVDSSDRLMTLELGVDDILEKPFSPKELIIKSLRLMDRSYTPLFQPERYEVLRLQDYVINEGTRRVKGSIDPVHLTSKEFDLLTLFARNSGQALSREQILNNIWGMSEYCNDRVVDDLVRRLRKKMDQLRIETIYGFGYRACV
ncbi:response regulator transcription factor [Acidaminobacter sp. JC074]|uniref:response regulator transcription factor n=1 Tax=Acidaminobacter sp. JC074 TaxID=2530199 RepID=UPI001F1096C7|nr:response regulator transcription factor [Acidaminobacter sp. JC074]